MTGDREVTLQVHGDHRVPLLLGHVEAETIAEDAGVVDHDVETAVVVERLVDQRLATGPRRDVVDVGHRIAAGGDDLVDHLLGRPRVGPRSIGRATHVVDHHAGAFARQKLRLFPADAAPGTGHQRHLAVEAAHEFLLRVDP